MKNKKKVIVLLVTIVLLFPMTIPSFATTEHWNDNSSNKNISSDWTKWKANWEGVKSNYEQLSLTPGATEKELNFAWYSIKPGQAIILISKLADMSNPSLFSGVSSKYKQIKGVIYYSNKVTANKLRNNTAYYYRYYLNGKWSDIRKYIHRGVVKFSFLYVGDPQIGASLGQPSSDTGLTQTAELAARNDAYSWNTTLVAALKANSKLSFIISAGDQINEKVKDGSPEKDLQQEIEYSGFLSSKVLASLPIATTIGNHDTLTANYKNHFNNPNSFTKESTPTKAGYDYYFTYGNSLFIILDTNNLNMKDHEALVKKATKANPRVTWRIVTIHHDIYGSGAGHSNLDAKKLRIPLTKLMDKYDIDVVLQGHDHTYSRSYLLTGDKTRKSGYKIIKPKDSASNQVTNPKGILYLEANSSTGSKYYNLSTTRQNYIASRSQNWEPSYSILTVTKYTLTINTYKVSTGKKVDKSYTIKKQKRID